MDPLAPSKGAIASARKTPQSFLGENSGLVNLDQLINTSATSTAGQPAAAYNPFGDIPKTNLFQQQMQPVSRPLSIAKIAVGTNVSACLPGAVH